MASRAIPLASPRLTPQQIADLALSADRDRRAALARGDAERAAELDAELDRLADAMRDAY